MSILVGSDLVVSVYMDVSWWRHISDGWRVLPVSMILKQLASVDLWAVTILEFVIEHVHQAFRQKIIKVLPRLLIELQMTPLLLNLIDITHSYKRLSFALLLLRFQLSYDGLSLILFQRVIILDLLDGFIRWIELLWSYLFPIYGARCLVFELFFIAYDSWG